MVTLPTIGGDARNVKANRQEETVLLQINVVRRLCEWGVNSKEIAKIA